MNGDLGTIYNTILEVQKKQIEITTKVDERHNENKEDISVLFRKLSKLDNLQCNVHAERMKWYGVGLKVLYGVTISVLLILVRVAIMG